MPCTPQKSKRAAARTIQLAQKLEKTQKHIKTKCLPSFFGGKWKEYDMGEIRGNMEGETTTGKGQVEYYSMGFFKGRK